MEKFPIATLNRGDFFRESERACERAAQAHTLSAVVLDVDHLDAINHEFGRSVGDFVVGLVAKNALYCSKIVGRLGGEEFVLLLEDHALPDAFKIAEALRRKIADRAVRIGDKLIKFTCSFGVEEWEFGETIDELLRRADIALFRAKAAGGNRTVGYNTAQSSLDDSRTIIPLRLGDR